MLKNEEKIKIKKFKKKKKRKKRKRKEKGNINVANEILQLNNSVHKLQQQRRHRRVIK